MLERGLRNDLLQAATATRMQPLPENADEETQRDHRIFAAKVQDRWRREG